MTPERTEIPMNDLLISLAVFAVIFGGALVGVAVRPRLSERHLQPDSKDVVKMATGLIGTLAALVLGLLIASAKSSFDRKTGQVRQMTAKMIFSTICWHNTVRKQFLSELVCGKAFRHWRMAFGMREGLRPASPFVSRRALSRRHSKMSWTACRRPMTYNARCNRAPLRPLRRARKPGCFCLRRLAVQSRRRF